MLTFTILSAIVIFNAALFGAHYIGWKNGYKQGMIDGEVKALLKTHVRADGHSTMFSPNRT